MSIHDQNHRSAIISSFLFSHGSAVVLDPSLLCIVSLCRSPISKIRAKFHVQNLVFFCIILVNSQDKLFHFYSKAVFLFHRSTKRARIKNSIQCFAHSQNRYYERYCLVNLTKKQISLYLSSVTFKLFDSRIYFQGTAVVGINKVINSMNDGAKCLPTDT